jgi:hypothetical protein
LGVSIVVFFGLPAFLLASFEKLLLLPTEAPTFSFPLAYLLNVRFGIPCMFANEIIERASPFSPKGFSFHFMSAASSLVRLSPLLQFTRLSFASGATSFLAGIGYFRFFPEEDGGCCSFQGRPCASNAEAVACSVASGVSIVVVFGIPGFLLAGKKFDMSWLPSLTATANVFGSLNFAAMVLGALQVESDNV